MKRDNGFSLLEILIALAILVVGVASVVNMFPIGLHAAKRGADFTSAGILAQGKMAEIMYLGYDNLGDIDGTGPLTSPPSDGDTNVQITFPSPDNAYCWFMYVDDEVNNIKNLAKATLLIYWNDRGTERGGDDPFITYVADR